MDLLNINDPRQNVKYTHINVFAHFIDIWITEKDPKNVHMNELTEFE